MAAIFLLPRFGINILQALIVHPMLFLYSVLIG
jgi:hypothetical protein